MGLCECNMNVLILLYHHKDQARFSVPDYVLDYECKLKLASQSVFFIFLPNSFDDFYFFPCVFPPCLQSCAVK